MADPISLFPLVWIIWSIYRAMTRDASGSGAVRTSPAPSPAEGGEGSTVSGRLNAVWDKVGAGDLDGAERDARVLVKDMEYRHFMDSNEACAARECLYEVLVRRGPDGRAAAREVADRILGVEERLFVPDRERLSHALLRVAHAAEACGDLAAAVGALTRALAVVDESPPVLGVLRAELLLEAGALQHSGSTGSRCCSPRRANTSAPP